MKTQLVGVRTHTQVRCGVGSLTQQRLAGYCWKPGNTTPQQRTPNTVAAHHNELSLLGQWDTRSLSCLIKGDSKDKNAELLTPLHKPFFIRTHPFL